MKICIIGSSGHYGYVLRGVRDMPGAAVIGVAPGSRGEWMKPLLDDLSDFGMAPLLFEDYETMLDELRPDIAAVACYFGDHAKVSIEVLRRGIHAFVEKPAATTMPELSLLREAYARSAALLVPMFGSRYSAPFLTVKQAVQDGAIGHIRLIHAQKSYRLGERATFYRHRSSYGGTILWVGSHAIDWIHWLSGERFASVFASHSTFANQGHGDLEASAICHFRMTNEVLASVSLDYLRPQQAPTSSDDRIRLVGTSGVLEAREGRVWLIREQGQGIEELPLQPEEEPFSDFMRHLAEGRPCRVSAEDAFVVTEASLKALRSADEQRVVYF